MNISGARQDFKTDAELQIQANKLPVNEVMTYMQVLIESIFIKKLRCCIFKKRKKISLSLSANSV